MIFRSLLFRYLVKGNTMLLLPTLAVGIGLYVLTDLFERLDHFMEANAGIGLVATYFLYKLPLVISQILPVIFLLSAVIQLCIMARSREMIALQAGGISLATPACILIICGLAWSAVQLGFSEVLGVMGERESNRIWQEEIRKRDLSSAVFENIWFADGQWMVSLGTLRPDNSGENFTAYEITDDRLELRRIVSARRYQGRVSRWELFDVKEMEPTAFRSAKSPSLVLPLNQDPATFRMFYKSSKPQQLPLWQLGRTIKRLSASGSNVESLKTTGHTKLAYAASLVIMALIAVALVSWTDNIYLATPLALVCTFLYYAVFTLGTALGQRGVLPPVPAAWGANIIALLLACLRLAPLYLRRSAR